MDKVFGVVWDIKVAPSSGQKIGSMLDITWRQPQNERYFKHGGSGGLR